MFHYHRLTKWIEKTKPARILGFCLCILPAVSCRNAGESIHHEKPARERIEGRSYPSVFQAWNPADNVNSEDELVTAARHDLIFHGAVFYGLKWNHESMGLATGFTPESIRQGLSKRRTLLRHNPNLVLLMEIRYRDAMRSFLPENHKWWKRDGQGNLVKGWEEGRFLQLDFANPEYRDHVTQRAAAAMESGVVDGIMLDWWRDGPERLALIRAIRDRIGGQALILANANDRKTPETASFINGYFMECFRSSTPEDWQRITGTLTWAEEHLREPRINCLQTWYHQSRADHHLMRAVTTLSMTMSDGYCLFSDPGSLPGPDHLHDWYAFWDTDLGSPLSGGRTRPDGSFVREFSKGTALYNPVGNKTVTVVSGEAWKSAATGRVARKHIVAPGDGDMFLPVPEGLDKPEADDGR